VGIRRESGTHVGKENNPRIYVKPQDKKLNTTFKKISALLIKYNNITRIRFYYINVNKRDDTKDSHELEENTSPLLEFHECIHRTSDRAKSLNLKLSMQTQGR